MGVTMNLHALFVLAIATLGAAVAAPSEAASPATYEGLAAVQSRDLDEFYLRPNADLGAYRKIVIDPVQVTFRKDWNKDFVDPHGSLRRLLQDDVRRIAEETASTLQSAVAEAFKARGYEIAAAPGPGVLRLSPSITDLYVNAAENLATGGTTKSFTKDAGEATLVLEARDSVSGTLLGRVVDHRTARETKGTQISDVRRTTSVSNNFWFDAMFRRWAATCAKAFEASKPSKIG
jgi:hypothetical protein